MRDMIKPSVVLLAVTLIAAFALGMVYDVTKEPIAQQKAKTEAETIALLLPGVEETRSEDIEDAVLTRVTACYAGGTLSGYAISAAPKGYSGAVEIMVGYDMNGVIQGVKLISHSETPGLGANAALPAFTDQFIHKSGPLTVTKSTGSINPDEVQAVTSATITSDAVVAGVNAASAYFETHLRKEAGQ